jgi:hypothetical protein
MATGGEDTRLRESAARSCAILKRYIKGYFSETYELLFAKEN